MPFITPEIVHKSNRREYRVPPRFVRKVSIRQKIYNYVRKYLLFDSLDFTI
jgi:hypothetical protein